VLRVQDLAKFARFFLGLRPPMASWESLQDCHSSAEKEKLPVEKKPQAPLQLRNHDSIVCSARGLSADFWLINSNER
jgi:hypothetical protein